MVPLRSAARRFAIATMVLGPCAASGQTSSTASVQAYPDKPIRMVVGAAGGSSDLVARLIAPGLATNLGQPVILDNRGGLLQIDIMQKAAADGYSLLYSASALWLQPFLRANVAYDPVRDFAPVIMAVSAPTVLVIHSAVSANSVKELMALARSRPGALNYSSGPPGSATHLAAELLKSMASVNIVGIPYKGQAPALVGLLAGEVQLSFPSGGAVTTHIKAGRLRALGITSAEPSALFPGLPTLAASGLPGYESVQMAGIFAPPKTSGAIIRRLNHEIAQVLNSSDVKERLASGGLEAVGGSPQYFAGKIKSEMVRMGKVIRDAGIRE